MDQIEVYIQSVSIVLAIMLVSVEACRAVGVSPVLGYILSGLVSKYIVGGPHEAGIHLISELGISFLMFVIGMKLSPKDLTTFRSYTIFSLAQILLGSIAIIGFLLYWIPSLPLKYNIILASSISLSSTALCTQLISEKRQYNAESSNSTMAALLIQDFFAILIIMCMQSMFYLTHKSGVSVFKVVSSYSMHILAVIGAIYVVNPIVHRVLRTVIAGATPESTIIFAMVLVFGTSLVTNKIKLSPELGPFIAGVFIAGTKYKDQVISEVYNISKVLLAFFFLSIGMSIDLKFFSQHMIHIFAVTGVLLAIKISIVVSALFFLKKKNWSENTKTAMLLSGLGEFTYVIIRNFTSSVPQNPELQELLSILTISIALSLVISSILYGIMCKPTTAPGKKPEYHVILIGLTKKTEIIARVLAQSEIPYVMIEKDISRLEYASSIGINAKFGDSENSKFIKSIIGDSQIVVLGFEAHISRVESINKICSLFPNTKIFCYASDEAVINKINAPNIEILLFSKKEQSFKVAGRVLEILGWTKKDTEELLLRVEN